LWFKPALSGTISEFQIKGFSMPASLYVLIAIIVILFLLPLLGGSLWLARRAIFPRKFSYEGSYQNEIEQGRLNEAEYNSWEKQEVSFRSPFGYDLSGAYFPQPGSNKTIIMLHGISYTRMGMISYMPMFRRRGWNILAYDQRFFGRSGGPNTSYGFYEKDDLKAAIDWAKAQLPADGVVGTLGISLGAVTCLQHAAIDPRPAFVIADAGFASLQEELELRLREDYHLPPFPILTLGEWWVRLLAGFHFDQVAPLHDAAALEMPVLFVHGQADLEVLPTDSQRMFDAKQHGLRRLYLVPEAGHVQSILVDPAGYDREVGEFLSEAGVE